MRHILLIWPVFTEVWIVMNRLKSSESIDRNWTKLLIALGDTPTQIAGINDASTIENGNERQISVSDENLTA